MKIFNVGVLKIHVLIALLFLLSGKVIALPVAIDNCILAGTCFYNGPVHFNNNLVNAHFLTDFRDGTPVQKVLMEYQLGAGSHNESVSIDPNLFQPLPVQKTGITGSLWLEASQNYDLTSSFHAMSLYFDQGTPDTAPFVAWQDTLSNKQNLLISTDGLLSGIGESYVGCCEINFFPAPFSPFSLSSATSPNLFDSHGLPPLACAADGCYNGSILNLVGLLYTQVGNNATLNLNPLDQRELVYFTAQGFEGYTHNAYTMSNVPIPAAVWLFGSGLVGLIGIARRKKS